MSQSPSEMHATHKMAGHRAGTDIGIDIGGTFTDIVFRHADGTSGHLKVPSSRGAPELAVQQGMARLFAEHGVMAGRICRFAHGTTVATNAVLERRGARLGLITSQGFRDVLEIGRQSRREIYDVIVPRQTPVFLCPRAFRREVPERLAADGSVVVALDETALASQIDSLVAAGVDAVAIVFLFAFIDPTHERRAREIVLERHPQLYVSLSSDVDPTFREYERTAATTFDAYVKPSLNRYLAAMETDLAAMGVAAPLQVMQSRGGVSGAAIARERPIRLFLSGPAAGVVGGRDVAAAAGIASIITVDIGGTSCDVALVADGQPLVRNEGIVDGFPVRVPMIDVNSVGSGGGSIAWVDGSGALRVGPRSAGAEPGPACYGRGGREPTVTDASVVLGYIDPAYFAGGSLRLDAEAAAAAIATVAGPLGMSVVDAALGIHRVVNAQMAEAIRLVSIHRGYDPRGFALVPLGGAGPLHATTLASELGITKILVPARPGVLSAQGLLAAPVEHEVFEGFGRILTQTDPASIRHNLAALDARAAALMARDGVAGGISVAHSADMCFVGQSYYLDVALPDAADEALIPALYEAFLVQHERIYGHAARNPAMIGNLRSVYRSQPGAAHMGAADAATGGADAKGVREIRIAGLPHSVTAQIYDRSGIAAGARFEGPAIVEQSDTTLLIEPGWRASVAPGGALLVQRITKEG